MIVLIVHMKIKPGTEQECKRLIALLEQNTRQEPGCIQYKGLQSTVDSTSFAMYEEYKDEAALQSHSSSDHFKQYVKEGLDKIVVERQRTLLRPAGE
jgi:(4S)-4-hydroxy-5-phosphonooxypentane-2,3-dione isomerase